LGSAFVPWIALAAACPAWPSAAADEPTRPAPEAKRPLDFRTQQELDQLAAVERNTRADAFYRLRMGDTDEALIQLERTAEQAERALEVAIQKTDRIGFVPPGIRPWDLAADLGFDLHVLARLDEARGDLASARQRLRRVEALVARRFGGMAGGDSFLRREIARLDALAALNDNDGQRLRSWANAVAGVWDGTPLGVAFCIDGRGLFVTSTEAVDPAGRSRQVSKFEWDEQRRLVSVATTNSATGTETRSSFGYDREGKPVEIRRTDVEGETAELWIRPYTAAGAGLPLRAWVLRRDRARNLALLWVEAPAPLPSLELAEGPPPAPGSSVTAITIETLMSPPTPARGSLGPNHVGLTARTARLERVASVRLRRGRPWLSTLEPSPPGGASGSPVVDDRGRVVGVLFSGLTGTGVHYVLPTEVLAEFLGPAQLLFHPPAVVTRDRGEAVEWTVTVRSSSPLPPSASLELALGEGPARRVFAGRRSAGDRFQIRVVPFVEKVMKSVGLHAGRRDGFSDQSWEVGNREITVGPSRLKLGSLRILYPGWDPSAYDAIGRALSGPIAGLDGLRAAQAGGRTPQNLARMEWISITGPGLTLGRVPCEIVLRDGDRVLERISRPLELTDPAFVVPRAFNPGVVAPRGSARSIRPPTAHLPVARLSREPRTAGPAPGADTPSNPLLSRLAPFLEQAGLAVGVDTLERKLPGAVTDAVLGGGGRYLLLVIGASRKLLVFDINEAAVTRTLPLAGWHALIAAGAEKAVLVYPALRFIHRIDLGTMTLDGYGPVPVDGSITQIAMGSDSDGPLLATWTPNHRRDPLHDGTRLSLIGLDSLKALEPERIRPDSNGRSEILRMPGELPYPDGFRSGGVEQIRASAGGELFTFKHHYGGEFATISLGAGDVRPVLERASVRQVTTPGGQMALGALAAFSEPFHAIPAPDGRSILTGAFGRLAVSGKPIIPREARPVAFKAIPSTDPRVYLGVTQPKSSEPKAILQVAFFDAATDRPVAYWDEPLEELLRPKDRPRHFGLPDLDGNGLDLDKRVFWVPQGRLLAVIPFPNDRLILRRVDLDAIGREGKDRPEARP
jgi:hypothetical protein